MRQTYHQRVPIDVFQNHTGEIWNGPCIEPADSLACLDIFEDSQLILEGWFRLPLSLHGLQRLLQWEADQPPQDSDPGTHEDDLRLENSRSLFGLGSCLCLRV